MLLYVGASVCGSWTRVQRGTCHVGSCSDLYTVLLLMHVCLSLFYLVCNFACDLCYFIVNVYSVKSSLELMLYCFIMCRIKIKFSYYITPTVVGWCIAILRFFFTIIIILIIFPHIFVRSISRRCLDQTLWNLVGISYAMWSCAVKVWFFQNGCRCHGNGQNAKKLKNTKMIIAGYSPNRNWWNLIGTTSTSSGTR
jgi:hypothetical protein